jgi:hypothetical protein
VPRLVHAVTIAGAGARWPWPSASRDEAGLPLRISAISQMTVAPERHVRLQTG